jgi:aminoglycoside phosphotransferase family enzyme/adenylate kinase family enzyme
VDKLIDSLLSPDAYDHPVSDIYLQETHISWVILTGDYAYKIKKPVNFGFVDFSSLARRKHFCDEEIRLNSRLAPDIYLEVVAINEGNEHPAVNGSGNIVEYAVKMRQFPASSVLGSMLDMGELRDLHMDWLAGVIADFHLSLPAAGSDTEFGSKQAVMQPVKDNFDHIRTLLDSEELLGELQAIENWCMLKKEGLEIDFSRRKTEGCIRECHGDLHLGNIIFLNEQVIPFDCIEFNEDLRWIDVLSEIAFLTMDLDDHQRPDLGGRFLNHYLELTGDYTDLGIFQFYKVYRAMVRAKVNALRLEDGNLAPDEVIAIQQECENYIRLAGEYIKKKCPVLMIMHGFSGSGKTTASRYLLEALPVIRIRSDVERKRLHNLQPHENSKSGIDSGIYSSESTRLTYDHLLKLSESILLAGLSVIVDGAFLDARQREQFKYQADRLGIPFRIIDCDAGHSILAQRIAERMQYGNDASEATMEVLERQQETHDPFSEDEEKITFTIDSTEASSMRTIIEKVAALMNTAETNNSLDEHSTDDFDQ